MSDAVTNATMATFERAVAAIRCQLELAEARAWQFHHLVAKLSDYADWCVNGISPVTGKPVPIQCEFARTRPGVHICGLEGRLFASKSKQPSPERTIP